MELFGTAGIRGPVDEFVTPELALAVGLAAGRDGDRWVLGRDGRVTGTALADAIGAGLEGAGATVRRVGVVPTPALAFASQGRRGVMLTASHNPPADNGIKLFVDGVEYDGAAERRIERRVGEGVGTVDWSSWGTRHDERILPEYRESIVEFATGYGAPVDGMGVVVDCGGGTAGLATPQVLRALGSHVHALNATVDGHFSARPSKPTADALSDLRRFVAGADDIAFGFGHDGDGDRIVVVDGDGDIVHEDTVLAIIAERYTAASDAPDPVVVTTPNASARIDERVEAAGGRVERIALGALHEGIARVRNEGTEGTTVVFAAEPWKHIHPELGGWIDAVASAAVFTRLVAAAGGIDALREPITERPYRKVSVACAENRKASAMERLTNALVEAFPNASVDTTYGIRLEWSDGAWILVRPSGTEPYIRLYAESDDVDQLADEARSIIEAAIERASGDNRRSG